jgi:hypothetical protein
VVTERELEAGVEARGGGPDGTDMERLADKLGLCGGGRSRKGRGRGSKIEERRALLPNSEGDPPDPRSCR